MPSDKSIEETGKRRVLDWIGYKKDEVSSTPMSPEMMLATIQKLQEEVAALRAQKDFHELDSQELEALASETAVTILATVHKRESEAKKAAAAIISAADKKAKQILAAAEKTQVELLASAEKIVKDAQKQAAQTISVAETSASTALKNATAETKQLVANGETEAMKVVRDATEYSERTRSEAETYANKARKEAEADVARMLKEVNDQAAAIRREIADSLEGAKMSHLAAAETQEKARQAAEKAYKTIIASIESFEAHSQNIQDKPKSAKRKS